MADPDFSTVPASVPQWERDKRAGVSIASNLQFKDICHSFGDRQVLDHVSLEVEPGEVLCLLGPSGSGKSTLLRIAAGLENPTAGQVLIDGMEMAGPNKLVPPEKRNVGLVFQDYALFPHLSILENVKFGLTAVGRREAERQAMHVLACVGMDGYASKSPHQLSGGEQQRVALARALAPRPGILLMDEPFSGLDARLRDSVREQTLKLLGDTRSTSVIVTHDPVEALRVADHIALMRNGKLVQHGTAEELYNKPNSLFSASFFTEVNVFRTKTANGRVETPLGTYEAPGLEDGAAVYACVRQSDLQVTSRTDRRQNGTGHFSRGWIEDRRYLGTTELIDLFVEGTDQPLRAHVRSGTVDMEKQEVSVSVLPGKLHVFPVEDQ